MADNGQRLSGKVALITGAASGIGAAHARLFAAHGAKVVVTDINADGGNQTVKDCGPEALFVPHDVTSAESWAEAVDATMDRFGGLDILVNNAGGNMGRGGPLETTPLANYDFVIALNLTGVWLGMQAVIAPMRARGGGSIVNVSSLAGMVGFPNMAAYTAAKWGVRGLTKAAANELAPDHIRVNSIHPGFTETRASAHSNLSEVITSSGRHLGARVPLNRAGQAEDLARAGLFLASDDSSYITGAELPVDGGVLISPMDLNRP
jgi:3alpha(or 20beta)-hydroxysteroid dehydrogenase